MSVFSPRRPRERDSVEENRAGSYRLFAFLAATKAANLIGRGTKEQRYQFQHHLNFFFVVEG